MSDIQNIINEAFENRADITPRSVDTHVKEAVMEAIEMLDSGSARVAEKKDGDWIVNEWLKKAVLLYFRIEDNAFIKGGFTNYYDKVPSKFADYNSRDFREGGARVVPPATARKGSYIASGTVLMPSYVNIGAYVDSGTMVDTWATVGSCAQIGKNVHLSGGVGIAGESSGGEYSQTGSVVLTAVDANELSGGEYTMVEESAAEVDCIVDMEHFLRFAEHWLRTDCSELNDWCSGADLDNLGSVDFLDLELFVYDWLYYCPLDWPLR